MAWTPSPISFAMKSSLFELFVLYMMTATFGEAVQPLGHRSRSIAGRGTLAVLLRCSRLDSLRLGPEDDAITLP